MGLRANSSNHPADHYLLTESFVIDIASPFVKYMSKWFSGGELNLTVPNFAI